MPCSGCVKHETSTLQLGMNTALRHVYALLRVCNSRNNSNSNNNNNDNDNNNDNNNKNNKNDDDNGNDNKRSAHRTIHTCRAPQA
eukprot:6682-Chlamydomonas_euryale.AAC.3